MERSVMRSAAVIAATAGLWACAVEETTAPAAESQVIVRAQALSSTAGLVVDISGPGISPALIFNIPVGTNSVASDTLSVPAGGGRRFVVTAIDTLGVATHRADTTIALVPGVQTPLALVMRTLSTNVGVTITFATVRNAGR